MVRHSLTLTLSPSPRLMLFRTFICSYNIDYRTYNSKLIFPNFLRIPPKGSHVCTKIGLYLCDSVFLLKIMKQSLLSSSPRAHYPSIYLSSFYPILVIICYIFGSLYICTNLTFFFYSSYVFFILHWLMVFRSLLEIFSSCQRFVVLAF